MNWDDYNNFDKWEFDCSHSHENKMQESFLRVLQAIRVDYNKAMGVTSGYRHPTHPKEIIKPVPGEHTKGVCADIAVSGFDLIDLLTIARNHDINRIGIAHNFLHLGIGDRGYGHNKAVWFY